MKIKKYMKEHEAFISKQLVLNPEGINWQDLKEKHEKMIAYMQHERLVHLLVTIAFGVFLMIALIISVMKPNIAALILTTLFLIMLLLYIAHYFFLENTIQRWYRFSDEIEQRISPFNLGKQEQK